MKRIAFLFMIPLLCTISCSKEEGQGGNGSDSTAMLGVSVKDAEDVIEVPQRQTLTFDLMVTSDPGPQSALYVTLGTDPGLVEKYNAEHSTSYQMLPSEAYVLPSAPLMLMRYNKKSATAQLQLVGAGCVADQIYLLPIVVDQVKGEASYEAPEDKAAYILFKMLPPDVTGTGVEDDPYVIEKADAFAKIGNMLVDDETVYFKLAIDIDFADGAWTPVNANGKPIALDGDNHVIRNVTAESGLFSALEGSVKNLILDGIDISAAKKNAGVLADVMYAGSTVENVVIRNSSISNTADFTGGLIGRVQNGTVKNVQSDCAVEGNARVGGLVGAVEAGTFTECVSSGDVSGTTVLIGGLIGYVGSATISQCSASGDVVQATNASTYARAGGLIGQMEGGSVKKCSATGNVEIQTYFGGGLIAVADGAIREDKAVVGAKEIVIEESYATGDVLYKQKGAKWSGAGGLIGRVDGGKIYITNCYATGAIKADRWSSGFVGCVEDASELTELHITNGFSSSDLSLVGPDASGNQTNGIVIGMTGKGTTECKGFVAWNKSGKAFCYVPNGCTEVSDAGNYYGNSGTISSQAVTLEWDTAVWDLSGDVPSLK